MRLIIAGGLKGQIIAAAKIAMSHGAAVTHTESLDQTLAVLRAKGADLLMIDVVQPIAAYVAALEAERIRTPIVACGTSTDTRAAVAAIQAGAREYVPLPPDPELIAAVLEAVAADQSRLIWRDPAMERVVQLASQIARSEAPVLVTGESGTGKEVIARHLHQKSGRKDRPFVAVNCAAIPDNLLESELFGHEKGAFTGAIARRIGKFEEANGGTLLLDEIESMPLLAQAKVLRVIQERVVERVGSNKQIPLDVRIIAASKVDLAAESEAGRFRADLYYRLNLATIQLAPLRDRGEDSVLLFHHFLGLAAQRFNKPAPQLHPADLNALLVHTWPGNVRELKAAADRFALGLESTGRSLDTILGARAKPLPSTASLADRVAAYERHVIEAELARHGDSIAAVVDALQVPRRTLSEKMARLGVRR